MNLHFQRAAALLLLLTLLASCAPAQTPASTQEAEMAAPFSPGRILPPEGGSYEADLDNDGLPDHLIAIVGKRVEISLTLGEGASLAPKVDWLYLKRFDVAYLTDDGIPALILLGCAGETHGIPSYELLILALTPGGAEEIYRQPRQPRAYLLDGFRMEVTRWAAPFALTPADAERLTERGYYTPDGIALRQAPGLIGSIEDYALLPETDGRAVIEARQTLYLSGPDDPIGTLLCKLRWDGERFVPGDARFQYDGAVVPPPAGGGGSASMRPLPLDGHTRPLTGDEAALLFPEGDFHNPKVAYGAHGFYSSRVDPFALSARFSAERLYDIEEVADFLAENHYPGDISSWRTRGPSSDMAHVVSEQYRIPLKDGGHTLRVVGVERVNPSEFTVAMPQGSYRGWQHIFLKTEDGWRLIHTIENSVDRSLLGTRIAVNESGTCAWIVEESRYERRRVVFWRNLLTGEIDLWYPLHFTSFTRHGWLSVYEQREGGTAVYGLRRDTLPGGTRILRAPDRLTVQYEETVFGETLDDTGHRAAESATALLTIEYAAAGKAYLPISFLAEAEEDIQLLWRYGGMLPEGGGMPSLGYPVGE